MPRFSYRAIRVKYYANQKTRRGFWNGTTAVTLAQNALLFGRLYNLNDIVKSLGEQGLSPEIVSVFVSSKSANVLPPHQAVVPTFTIPGNVAPAGKTAVIRQ